MESGLAALQNAIAQGKERSSSRGSKRQGGEWDNRLNYFSWKDGDVKVVRFLTDDVKTAEFAEFVLTNDGKSQNFLVDPANNLVAKYGGKTRERPMDPSSPLIDPPLRKRTAAVAVLRAEKSTGNGRTEIVDHLYEKQIGDTSYQARWFGIIRQAHNNFWFQLAECAGRYGTLCDRDYVIKRSGGGLDTTYSILPCDPVEELRDLKVVQEFYGYGRKWNAEDPDRFLFCPQTIEEWVEYYSSEDRVRHFLGKEDAPGAVSFSPAVSSTPADEAQAAPSPGGTDFASLRERLIPHAK